MYKIALIPGTFDPITNGHLELITWASLRYDKVIVGIFINPSKKPMFTLESRQKAIEFAVKDFCNVSVITDSGYVSDFAIKNNVTNIIKGFRNETDYEYEKYQAIYNKEHSNVDTILLESKKDLSNISSTNVRNKISQNIYDIDEIPKGILDILEKN